MASDDSNDKNIEPIKWALALANSAVATGFFFNFSNSANTTLITSANRLRSTPAETPKIPWSVKASLSALT